MFVAVNIVLGLAVIGGIVALIGWTIRHEHKLYGAHGVHEPGHVRASRRVPAGHRVNAPSAARRQSTVSASRA